ncbi:hypothetical protein PS3A_34670 [Pseudomonas sp. 3A(2025)]
MKTSLRHAVAMAALTGVLSVPALAATVPAAAVSDIPAGAGQPMAPGGSALPPGTLPAQPSDKVRPETLMTPDSDENRAKKPAVERIDPTKHQPSTPDPKPDTQKDSH